LQDLESIDDNTVKLTCKTINIYNRIEELPGGYYTPVDQNVHSLDRKETRRIILAQLLLQKPEIIICDRAITTLYKEIDEDLREALKGSLEGRTVLVIE
jgi:ABC-type multidrug transport system fused ATPase/permease subunit